MPKENTAPNASKGYLSEFQDRSTLTSYQRDLFGRVVTKTQTLPSANPASIQYAYTAAGQLATLVSPFGHTLGYVYDTTGRLVRMDWDGVPQITNIT